MKTTEIGNRGVMFTFETGESWNLNCYAVGGNEHNFLIDTAFGSQDAEQMKSYITKRFGNKPIVVINTHHHWDHVWGNFVFTSSSIVSHTLCKTYLNKYWDVMLAENVKHVSGKTEKRLPDVLFDKEYSFSSDGLFLFASSGHTADGICVLDTTDRVLYAGDNIGDAVDYPVPYLDCSKQDYLQALLYMKSLDFDVLCSGHNVVLDKSFIDRIISELG